MPLGDFDSSRSLSRCRAEGIGSLDAGALPNNSTIRPPTTLPSPGPWRGRRRPARSAGAPLLPPRRPYCSLEALAGLSTASSPLNQAQARDGCSAIPSVLQLGRKLLLALGVVSEPSRGPARELNNFFATLSRHLRLLSGLPQNRCASPRVCNNLHPEDHHTTAKSSTPSSSISRFAHAA